ncbi:MAG: ribonuclease J [Patescibacteria group bacterium]
MTMGAARRAGPESLRIIPIGGCEEVGRNMVAFETKNDIVIVDMGLQFPEEDMPGIDYIIPNISYFKGKEKKIRGVIITHGHYDHIGAIPHLIHKLGNPVIFGSDLTLGIIRKRQDDFHTAPLRLQTITHDSRLTLGAFHIDFFAVSHNVPGSLGVVLDMGLGPVVHTGDFKIDPDPNSLTPTDMDKIMALGHRNVLCVLADSTNASQPGKQLTEGEIQSNIEDIVAKAPGRMIVGTFASLLSRIQQIIFAAEKSGKHIIVEGFSMKSNLEIAKELGYMKIKRGTLITPKEMKNYAPNKIVILCTGAQGEDNAVLMRIANREHRYLHIEPGDTVVFSSSVIPGNERSVQRLIDGLYREGAEVIHYQMMDIHAGGHARQEDLKAFYTMVKPRNFIPIYGNHSFLKMNAKLAQQVGIPADHIFIPDNGSVVEFTARGGRILNEKVVTDYVFVDGLGVGDVSEVVLRDRQIMSEDGMLVLIATIDSRTGNLVHNPDIISRGFVYLKESKALIEDVRMKVKQILKDRDPRQPANEVYLKDKVRNEIGQFLFQRTERRPMILPVIIEV